MLKPELLRSLGRAFQKRVERKGIEYDDISKDEKTRPRQGRAQWIGKEAEAAWIAKDLEKHCGRRKIIDPISAVSNMGDPRRTDVVAFVAGEMVQFELKKSKYGGSRVLSQLNAQVFDLGLGTYGASTLNVIYGENGKIEIYTREDAKRAVDAVLDDETEFFELPKPATVIEFGPDSDKP